LLRAAAGVAAVSAAIAMTSQASLMCFLMRPRVAGNDGIFMPGFS
jgi:hypothetical protein